MSSEGKGLPLPKFGEWDVNNPASAEGFTVIFNKARDEKKTSGTAGGSVSPGKDDACKKNGNAPFPQKVRVPNRDRTKANNYRRSRGIKFASV
ncbi:PREDICTED: uncharacterized protein LOC104591981 [Nelumbo nucifera]|uniref:Uncharacterized protein LOC104591981 n=1 Tax=Nelumbo nucifera TaxID=4432 RepID=A0A1U8Q2U8_NELNU|nr:PREDICTED: uncharacterized protein LOC104591981 [Nelumbo nucifera]